MYIFIVHQNLHEIIELKDEFNIEFVSFVIPRAIFGLH